MSSTHIVHVISETSTSRRRCTSSRRRRAETHRERESTPSTRAAAPCHRIEELSRAEHQRGGGYCGHGRPIATGARRCRCTPSRG